MPTALARLTYAGTVGRQDAWTLSTESGRKARVDEVVIGEAINGDRALRSFGRTHIANDVLAHVEVAALDQLLPSISKERCS